MKLDDLRHELKKAPAKKSGRAWREEPTQRQCRMCKGSGMRITMVPHEGPTMAKCGTCNGSGYVPFKPRIHGCDKCKNTGFEGPYQPCRYCAKGLRAISIARRGGKIPDSHMVKCRDCSEMVPMNDAVGEADEGGRVRWRHAPGKECYPF